MYIKQIIKLHFLENKASYEKFDISKLLLHEESRPSRLYHDILP